MDRYLNAMDNTCRDRLCLPCLGACSIKRPRTIITILFLLSTILVFMAFIVGCVVASDKDLDPTLQFAALWSSFYYIALTAAGVAILRKYKAPLPIGIFIGLVFVQSNLCLMLCAIFGNIADVIEDDDVDRPYEAFSAFQFFLFTVYSIFGVSLTVFRNELIEDPFSSEGGRNSNDEPGGGFGEKTLPPPVDTNASDDEGR